MSKIQNASWILVALLNLSACNGGGDSPAVSNTDTRDAALLLPADAPQVPDLAGRWRWVGRYCGTSYSVAPYVQHMEFDGSEVETQRVSGCGITETMTYHDFSVTSDTLRLRLNRQWSGCGGATTVPSSPAWVDYPIRTLGSGQVLEITTGTCGAGKLTVDAYQKQ